MSYYFYFYFYISSIKEGILNYCKASGNCKG